ncbi:hypothetical protein [Spiroplasma endosymbiont of Seladonia tumulorum]|uniref:hypothetical protein n=1 Tax=Spiroplasma endosymbiont of Seladonia tumulorum TaxID=3066321 RepID=UPI0030CDC2F1
MWHGNVNDDWKIIKFKYDKYEKNKVLDKYNNYELQLFQTGKAEQGYWKSICLVDNNGISKYFAWSFYPNYFKSVYRWNNDIEPNLPFISFKTGQITDWNLKQQVNINNNKNNEIKVNVKNNDISENPIYQLEANYFNWLSITNELETNSIPSLIPAEIKLSDGEYGKYLTNLIVSNYKIEEYLNYFSQRYRLIYSKAV